mmetsp:Transcript_33267/g.45577  ORF Transcript_33267/g.45577 Transcript_33267/m.45577 type:complete len:139 (+) Transcript_33267:85-501(+)
MGFSFPSASYSFFLYFENARIAYFNQLLDQHLSSPLKETYLSGKSVGIILAKASCTFRFPLSHPDWIVVYSGVTKIQSDRFEMDYEVFSTDTGQVAAVGSSLIVSYDYETNKKVPIPNEVVEAIQCINPNVEIVLDKK